VFLRTNHIKNWNKAMKAKHFLSGLIESKFLSNCMTKLIRLISLQGGKSVARTPLGAHASASASRVLLHALAVVVLIAGIAGPDRVAAYNVCADGETSDGANNGACTHEIMGEQALDLYHHHAENDQSGTPHPYKQEIMDNWLIIKRGIGHPDEFDPIYDNEGVGGALVTISHFWQPDESLDAPMEFNDFLGGHCGDLGEGIKDDDYPNAHQAAQALWTRALGEYAAGNKTKAYQYLGYGHTLFGRSDDTHSFSQRYTRP